MTSGKATEKWEPSSPLGVNVCIGTRAIMTAFEDTVTVEEAKQFVLTACTAVNQHDALLAENAALRACLERWDSAYYCGPVCSEALNDAAEAASKLLEGKSDG